MKHGPVQMFIRFADNRVVRIICGGLALFCAMGAVSVFNAKPIPFFWSDGATQSQRYLIAGGLCLAAMLAFAVNAAGWKPAGESKLQPLSSPFVQAGRARQWQKIPWIIAGMYFVSLILICITGENVLVQVLWAGGIALFLIYLGQDIRGSIQAIPDGGMKRGDWLALTLICLAGFLLRFYRLAEIPSDLHGDLASHGLYTLELSRAPLRLFGFGDADYPLLNFDFSLAFMRIFGMNLYGLQMGSVISGTGTVLATFFLGRETAGKKVGLLAAALIAISYSHIHFSRTGLAEPAILLIVLLFIFLFMGLRRQETLWYGLAGISLGLCYQTFQYSRVSLVIILFLLGWLWLWKSTRALINLRNMLAAAAGAVLALGPMLVLFLLHFGEFLGRANVVTIANRDVYAHLMTKYNATSPLVMMLEQFTRTVFVFIAPGDASPHFYIGAPIVGAATAIFFLLGLGYSLYRIRDGRYFTLFNWIGLVLLMGGILTNDPPFFPHLLIVLPPVMILAGVGITRVWEWADTRHKAWRIICSLIIWAGVVAAGISGWQIYTRHTSDNAGTRTRIARYINGLPADTKILLVSQDNNSWDREYAFFNLGMQIIDLEPEDITGANAAVAAPPYSYVITSEYQDLVAGMQAAHPGSVLAEHRTPSGFLCFYSLSDVPYGYAGPERNAHSSAAFILPAVILLAAGVWGGYARLRRNRHAHPGRVPEDPRTGTSEASQLVLPRTDFIQANPSTVDEPRKEAAISKVKSAPQDRTKSSLPARSVKPADQEDYAVEAVSTLAVVLSGFVLWKWGDSQNQEEMAGQGSSTRYITLAGSLLILFGGIMALSFSLNKKLKMVHARRIKTQKDRHTWHETRNQGSNGNTIIAHDSGRGAD